MHSAKHYERKKPTTRRTKKGKNERTANGVFTIPNTLEDPSDSDQPKEGTTNQI